MAYKDHVSEMVNISDEDRNAYFAGVDRAANALHKAFSPDKINYGAYGDGGCHLHFHLVPKYKSGSRLRSYGPHSETGGISHGLKKCPPDTFLPAARAGLKVNCCEAAREGGLGHSIPTQIIMKKLAPA